MKEWTKEEIKQFRECLELSQPAFGKLIGVTGNYVYLIEKGVKKPSRTLVLLLNCIEEKASTKKKGKGGN